VELTQFDSIHRPAHCLWTPTAAAAATTTTTRNNIYASHYVYYPTLEDGFEEIFD
jgi:hypothetical protein